jgi:hypothetical protein
VQYVLNADIHDNSIVIMSRPDDQEPTPEKSTYLNLVQSLAHRFPSLVHLTSFVERQLRQPVFPVCAAVLEFRDDEVRKINFDDKDGESGYEKLQVYLSSSSSDCQHRLYLLEDLDAPFVELLGAYLNIDGTVFASQIRDTHYSGEWKSGHQPKLPSFHDPNKSFTLRYYEARYFDDCNISELSSAVRTMGNIQRQVTFGIGKSRHYTGHVGLIRRNTSFWSRVEGDGSWNGSYFHCHLLYQTSDCCIGIILLDPPIVGFEVKDRSQHVKQVPNLPYQGGYRDSSSWPESPTDFSTRKIRGPYRISLLHDIAFYWTETASPSQISDAIKSPYNSTLFLRNIIASTWMNTMEYFQAILSELETKLWGIERMIAPDLSDADMDQYMREFTTALNEINTMRRRLNWYVSEMKTNLEALGISPNFPSSNPQPSDSFDQKRDQDSVSIYNRLVNYQNWAEKLMNVIMTHVNLIQTEKSISDSKSLARLTVLGFFFVPLSFVATIFSMGGDFSVGQSRFWIYFAVSVPLTLMVFVVAFRKWRAWWN